MANVSRIRLADLRYSPKAVRYTCWEKDPIQATRVSVWEVLIHRLSNNQNPMTLQTSFGEVALNLNSVIFHAAGQTFVLDKSWLKTFRTISKSGNNLVMRREITIVATQIDHDMVVLLDSHRQVFCPKGSIFMDGILFQWVITPEELEKYYDHSAHMILNTP